ncbi:MAG: fatty acid cis/trans isomerase [Oxalicibacterium faecigallinarum]|uniref:fatty acid cis/trans isomerase n=1 Tax=Oxalicibacterium faecigallinarum TaxID=573741 RepID=UPI002806E193|nr:fatty acid cis/trans isomerase [Oxalicibacterium faecigallinarum]MDQ7969308.1 fatty acid cis/trans isomerase [Oxalicibacterium faecigallinarum]
MRRLAFISITVLVTACTTFATAQYDNRYGAPDPTRHDQPKAPPTNLSYQQVIRPILNQRCVVCHACYDAPCQFKTTSWEGLARGASKTLVYDPARLTAATPSRLYIDADKASDWRGKGFFPMLNEQEDTPEANRSAGLMYRMLKLKQDHAWLQGDAAHAKMDISPTRANMCPAGVEMDAYEQNVPLGGMPFALPAVSDEEYRLLTRWLEMGAPYEGLAPLPAAVSTEVENWERFFNGDSNKERLFARYAYEHLFLAHLYFDSDTQRNYFKLTRSSTPPGQPIREIASARPVDDPKVARVYYRLAREREEIVSKTHMPYRLDAQRMARWRALFLTPRYDVPTLPGYSEQTAANPFDTFSALPVGARYRFMLDEAEFTIMGFIKGPVCRGQLALNVIQDQFWVTFLAPSDDYDRKVDSLLRQSSELAALPTGSHNSSILLPWLRYGRLQNEYLAARNELLREVIKKPSNLDLDLLWDGDGRNDNAALTIFRHFDGASVVKGFVGDTPKTAWVIGYPLLERIHYLLVANYDVYGNLGHQFNSRLYMDYLRAEGESNFIMLLPKKDRIAVRDDWYRDEGNPVREQVYGGPNTTLDMESGVRYSSNDSKRELLEQMRKRLARVINTDLDWKKNTPTSLHAGLGKLATVTGTSLQWMPESALLVVDMPDGQTRTFSLIRNTAHASVSHLLGEKQALVPEEDTLTLTPGIITSYPNALYRAKASELRLMADDLRKLHSEKDYAAFTQRWAMRRDNPQFWAFSDALHERFRKEQPKEAGILDYNRLEYR